MKNPKAKYVLFPVVGLIWGLVILRYLGFFDGGVEPAQPVAYGSGKVQVQEVTAMRDTFSLLLSYPDPFLTVAVQRVAVTSRLPERPLAVTRQPVNPPSTEKPAIQYPMLEWEAFTYLGTVKAAGSDSRVGLLRFKGKTLYVKPGDYVDNRYLVTQFWDDSIRIEHKKEKRIFRR